MSRVFDALRKSETLSGKSVSLSPDSFFAGLANVRGKLEVATDQIEVFPEDRIVVYSAPDSPGGERFRLLRSQLKELRAGGTLKSLLITSPSSGDGKSTMAINLATALAEKGKYRVLLLETDLRRPSLTARLKVKPAPGVTECVQSGADPLASIRRIEPLGIHFLPAGARTPMPLELLQSEAFGQLVTSLGAHFDWIVLDAPPVIPIADALVLNRAVDATFLVVRAGQTNGEALNESVKQLRNPILGIILNCAEGLEDLYGHYHGR
jgi:succinoglycan biosynthesis transport protein ExoP